MQNDKLLPCPFCGGEAKIVTKNKPYFSIWCECSKCEATTPSYCPNLESTEALANIENSKRLAIGKWNTRKPMERIVEQLQECKFVTSIGNDIISRNKFIAYNGALNIVRKEGGIDNAE